VGLAGAVPLKIVLDNVIGAHEPPRG